MNIRIFGVVPVAAALSFSLGGAAALADEGDPSRGEELSRPCAACHGADGNSPIPTMYPSIAGVDAEVLEQMLKDFRDGEREEPQMSPQAANLSDQDIRDLAAYFAAQEPE
ncbi:cytochrome c [Aquisalimonas sp.]|uniref:c-type cytochrome n=1 Tax=Aquisalimonas sp. TaxID=1872621 RepID=UPI0025C16A92|nr:cytochrome c [Aquisalimonas sp.]